MLPAWLATLVTAPVLRTHAVGAQTNTKRRKGTVLAKQSYTTHDFLGKINNITTA